MDCDGESDAYEGPVLLPAKEFDHEYGGRLTVIRGPLPKSYGYTAVACATVNVGTCTIYLPIEHPYYDALYRHERAHCNGWHHKKEEPKL